MSATYTIFWNDAKKTILCCEVTARWTWTEAFQAIEFMNKECDTVNHGVYSVLNFKNQTSFLPQGSSALANFRKLMGITHPNDQLTFLVGANPFTRSLIDIASKIYGLSHVLARLRFVATLEEALAQIEMHKQQKLIAQ